jgi:hypothetical protein
MTAVKRRGPQGQQWHGWRGKILQPPKLDDAAPLDPATMTASERSRQRGNTRTAIARWTKRLERSEARIAKPTAGDLQRWAAMRAEIARLQAVLETLNAERKS